MNGSGRCVVPSTSTLSILFFHDISYWYAYVSFRSIHISRIHRGQRHSAEVAIVIG